MSLEQFLNSSSQESEQQKTLLETTELKKPNKSTLKTSFQREEKKVLDLKEIKTSVLFQSRLQYLKEFIVPALSEITVDIIIEKLDVQNEVAQLLLEELE